MALTLAWTEGRVVGESASIVPLTFAHPAAAVPMTRWGFPLSTLVVGSMAPDFVYFLKLFPHGHFGHTLPGLLLFCLPVSLGVLWVFHRILTPSLVALSPTSGQARFVPLLDKPFYFTPFSRFVMVALGILLGSSTHIVWDAFTHAGDWGVAIFPGIGRTVALGPIGEVHGYTIGQYGSTLVGLALLIAWFVIWWRDAPRRNVRPRLSASTRVMRLALLGLVSLSFATIYSVWVTTGSNPSTEDIATYFLVAATSGGFVALVVHAIVDHRYGAIHSNPTHENPCVEALVRNREIRSDMETGAVHQDRS